MTKLKRAASPSQLMNTKFNVMDFTGKWNSLLGNPELKGCWLVWGQSGNGKTSFLMQLAKYLTNFGRVAYDSLEEGFSESLRKAVIRENMMECEGKFIILDKEPIDELILRLEKRKSPDINIIDSVQYTGLNKITAKQLINRFPKKLFIFCSHAYGKLPDGRTANAIRFDANIKIRVEGYRATALSRYGGEKDSFYTIYEEGAAQYYGELNTALL